MNKKRINENKELYRKRQQIVEHPYETIKRQWGFSYILTKKGINRASADVGLIMTAYNIRRIISIIGINELKKYLKRAFSLIHEKMMLAKLFLRKLSINIFRHKTRKAFLTFSVNQLYLIRKLTVSFSFQTNCRYPIAFFDVFYILPTSSTTPENSCPRVVVP